MKFVRSLLIFILVCAVILAVYRVFGGDLGALAAGIWGFLYSAIDAVAKVLVEVGRVFGIG